MGLRLAFDSKQKIECADIGQYSTMHVRYVNDLVLTHLNNKFLCMSTHMGNSNIFLSPYD